MSDIILFISQEEITARENLTAFILKCKNELTAFGADLSFDDDRWDITDALARKGMGNKRERITYCPLATVKSKLPESMHPEFKDFAKAFIRYQHALRPSQSVGRRLGMLRVVLASLLDLGLPPHPSKINAEVLNRAIQIAGSHFKSEALIQRIGGQLQQLIKFLNTNRLVPHPVYWKNPLRRPSDAVKVGKKADEDRLKKMPSEAALDALPKVFRLAKEPNEIIVSSTAAILFSMPSRIHEVLTLPVLCEDETTYGKSKKKVYSLRWWPGRGAPPMLKPVLSSTSSLAKEALARIRSETEAARAVAKWYQQHPKMIYLSDKDKSLRQKDFLSLQDVMDVLGLPHLLAVKEWCKAQKITVNSSEKGVKFQELERAVLKLLPTSFPVFDLKTGLKYGGALYVVLKNQLHSTRHTIKCLIEPVSINMINYGLGSRVAHGSPSIFTRLQLTEPDGSPLVIHSHQLRHYLNTLAHIGGLSQLDIAKWSGRKNIRQNVVYDHVTDDQALEIVRKSIGDSSQLFGPLGKLPVRLPISRDEYAILKVQTAHTTDIGFCINDFTMFPCEMHLDCLFCKNLVCLKRDKEKRKRIKHRLEEAQDLLAKAQEAVQEGYYGSDRWLDHHKQTVARLTELHNMMEDNNIHDAAVIQLAPPVKRGKMERPRSLSLEEA